LRKSFLVLYVVTIVSSLAQRDPLDGMTV